MSILDIKPVTPSKTGGMLVAAVIFAGTLLRVVLPSGTGIGRPDQGSSAVAFEQSSSAENQSKTNKYAIELAQKIKDSFGCTSPSDSASLDPPGHWPDHWSDHWNVPESSRGSLRFIVAFVPDPVHTHLSLLFDRDVESLQLAVQQHTDDKGGGYAFDRSILPWQLSAKNPSETRQMREAAARERVDRETYPGLLIFRRERSGDSQTANWQTTRECPARDALFIFLIAETPTSGIRTTQFQNALRIMREIRKTPDAKPGPREPLLLLGPNFSGSLDSLSRQIPQIPPEQNLSGIFSYSGTISSAGSSEAFRSHFPNAGGTPVQFDSFQENDDYLIQMFGRFAYCRGYSADEIAVLSEDDTVYGNQNNGPRREWSFEREPKNKSGLPACQNLAVDWKFRQEANDMLYLHFPREISYFREAYQKELAAQQQTVAKVPGKASLPMITEDEANDEDNVVPFANGQTSLSQEAVMTGVVSELQKHHIKFTILLATNPVDQVFLARYLRSNYPQGRVVVTTPDLLLTSQEDSLLYGVLGLSNYALVPGLSDSLCRSPSVLSSHSDRLFVSSTSVGIFNAMQGLLALHDRPKDAKVLAAAVPHQVPEALYAEYASPMLNSNSNSPCSAQPLLWLTILGADGYWPIAALTTANANSLGNTLPIVPTSAALEKSSSLPTVPGPINLPENARVPMRTRTAWNIIYCISLAALVLHAFFSLNGSFLANSESRAQFARSHDWRGVVVIAFGAFWLATAFVLILCARNLLIHWKGGPVFTAVLWFPLLAFVLVTIHDVGKLREQPEIAWLFGLFTGLMVVFQILLSCNWIPGFPYHWSNRLTHLGSGVSPILPFLFLCAAGYWWCWLSLRSISLVDLRRPRLPDPAELPVTSVRISEQEGEIVRSIAHPLNIAWPPVAIISGITAVGLAALDWNHPLQSLEGVTYDWGFCLALGIALVVFLGCLARFVFTWANYRQILAGLDRSPLREAFSRMKRLSWSSMWNPGGSTLRETYRVMSRTLENMDRLKHYLDTEPHRGPAGVLDKINDTQERLEDVLNEYHALFPQAGEEEHAGELMNDIQTTHEKLRETVTKYDSLFAKSQETGAAIPATANQVFRFIKQTHGDFSSNLVRYQAAFALAKSRQAAALSAEKKDPNVAESWFGKILLISKNPRKLFSGSDDFLKDPARVNEVVKQIKTAHHRLRTAIFEYEEWFAKAHASQTIVPDGAHARLKKIRHAQAKLTAALDRYASFFPESKTSDARSEILAHLTSALEEVQKQMANTAGAVYTKILQPKWKEALETSVSEDERLKKPELEMPRAIEEEFVALVFVNFLQSVLLQMRTLVICAGGMYVLVLCAMSIYPFEPHLSLQILAVSLLVVMAAAIGFVYAQMHRDTILSRLTSTTAGELGWDFWLKFVSAGAIPVFSLLAVQFPEIGRFLFSWLAPALQALK